ncbi:sulfatase [uncultured Lutibacter sp.]|uniref:sulfatase n=1 Tax=uncultured Lutibacter sp. TaxID=437739 RepID=UPI0026036B0E|nr:sulfatase [uncultured Lutibacter sp.]
MIKNIFISLCLFISTIGYNQNKPNIVYINIDDLGWTDLSCYGSTYYETPNIDKLAAKGIRFTNAYASAANCAPSRAGLLSGMYSPRHGIYTVNNSDRGKSKHRKLIPIKNTTVLHDSIITIAEALKKSGYTTASIGKWHLGKTPKTQGFDYNVGGTHAGHPQTYFSPYKNPNLKDGPIGEYLTDRLTNEAITFINKNKNAPFFLYLTYYTVHTPIQGKKELIDKYNQKKPTKNHFNPTYAAMVEAMDSNIGKLMSALKNLNLTQKTLIIVTSDNGGLYSVSKQTPLKHGKGSYYEGGVRVPLIINWEAKIKPNTISETPVNNIDFYPTFLEITNTKAPKTQPQDGQSLTPILFNKGTFKKRPLFWHFPIYLQAEKGFNNDTGRDPYFRTRPGSTIRYGKWKLHYYYENNEIELYNLKDDISENHNLLESHTKKVKKLLILLNDLRIQTKAPIPTKLNPTYKNEHQNESKN